MAGDGAQLPQALCGCGHIEGVHLVTDTAARGPCGAAVGGVHGDRPRCPCRRFAPGGRALADPPPPEPDWKVEKCRRCWRPVIWVITTNAKLMPVDAEPALQGGTIRLQHRGPNTKPLATVLSTAAQFGRRNLRKPHQVTCVARRGPAPSREATTTNGHDPQLGT